MLRASAPALSANGLKLYVHACLRLQRPSGVVEATEDELLKEFGQNRKALTAGFKELRDKGLCHVELDQAKRLRITSGKSAQAEPEASAAG
jgi:hypothetical protein